MVTFNIVSTESHYIQLGPPDRLPESECLSFDNVIFHTYTHIGGGRYRVSGNVPARAKVVHAGPVVAGDKGTRFLRADELADMRKEPQPPGLSVEC